MTVQSPIHRILLPLDGSDLATVSIPYAQAMATPTTELILLRVVPDPVPLTELAGAQAFPIDHIRQSELKAARNYLQEVANALRDVSSNKEVCVCIGQPADEILRVAEENDVDLIAIATHGRGFLGRVIVGSVADRVARFASMPVMLIHPHGEVAPSRTDSGVNLQRLIVPLDGSPLARQALPVAVNVAQQLGVPIHLIRALVHKEDMEPDWVDENMMERGSIEAAMEEDLKAEASRLRAFGLSTSSELVVGPAAQSILTVTKPGDMIIMASHGQGGLRRWLLGSVADKVLRAGTAPLILVPVHERKQVAAQRRPSSPAGKETTHSA